MSDNTARDTLPKYLASDIAEAEMERVEFDVKAATEALEALALKDPDVLRALTVERLHAICYDECRRVCMARRKIVWTAPNYDAGGKGERIRQHAMTLLDFNLPGGKPLRNATHQDVIEGAEFYRKLAESNGAIARWLHLVAEKVKRGTVGEKLTAKQLTALRDKAQGT